MEWSIENSLNLIQEYSKHEVIWNPKHKLHFHKIKKFYAWKDIGEKCSIDVDEAKKKMSSLLGSFRREKAKGKKTIGTGRGTREVYKTSWYAFRSFEFLMDRDDPRTSLNTETISDSNIEYIDNFQNDGQSDTITEDDAHTEHSSIASQSDTDNIQQIDVMERNANGNKFAKPPTTKRKRASKEDDGIEDARLERAFQFLQRPEDPSLIYAQYLSNKLKQWQGRTRTLIEHAINKVIFDAEMGLYDTDVPAVQSTPPYDVQSTPPYDVHCTLPN